MEKIKINKRILTGVLTCSLICATSSTAMATETGVGAKLETDSIGMTSMYDGAYYDVLNWSERSVKLQSIEVYDKDGKAVGEEFIQYRVYNNQTNSWGEWQEENPIFLNANYDADFNVIPYEVEYKVEMPGFDTTTGKSEITITPRPVLYVIKDFVVDKNNNVVEYDLEMYANRPSAFVDKYGVDFPTEGWLETAPTWTYGFPYHVYSNQQFGPADIARKLVDENQNMFSADLNGNGYEPIDAEEYDYYWNGQNYVGGVNPDNPEHILEDSSTVIMRPIFKYNENQVENFGYSLDHEAMAEVYGGYVMVNYNLNSVFLNAPEVKVDEAEIKYMYGFDGKTDVQVVKVNETVVTPKLESRIVDETVFNHTGWSSTEKSTKNGIIQPGTEVQVIKDMTLYAVWESATEATEAEVTYKYGFDGKTDVKTVKIDTKIKTPKLDDHVADGYLYKHTGWSYISGSAEDTVVKAGKKIIVTKDITLYAVWEGTMIEEPADNGKVTVYIEVQEGYEDWVRVKKNGVFEMKPNGTIGKETQLLSVANKAPIEFIGWAEKDSDILIGEGYVFEDEVTLVAMFERTDVEEPIDSEQILLKEVVFRVMTPSGEYLQVNTSTVEKITGLSDKIVNAETDLEGVKIPSSITNKARNTVKEALDIPESPVVWNSFEEENGTYYINGVVNVVEKTNVTFNGGFVEDTVQEVVVNKSIEMPQLGDYAIGSTTMKHVGWSTIEGKDDGQGIKPGDMIKITEETTFYAIWGM